MTTSTRGIRDRIGHYVREINELTGLGGAISGLGASAPLGSFSQFDLETAPADGPYVFKSECCRAEHFLLPLFEHWCKALKQELRFHRKLWEFVYIVQVLHERNCLMEGARGLGFAVGQEPLADFFASRGVEVLATDLDPTIGAEKGWAETNQLAFDKWSLYRGICAKSQFDYLVSFANLDMNHIPGDIGEFDFCWSACSLEHLGSIEKGARFLEESLRPLRPGGLSVHTTEFNVSSDDATVDNEGTVIFRRRDIKAIAARLRELGHEVAPLNFYPGAHALDAYVDLPPYKDDPHLKLRLAGFACTSIGLIITKGGKSKYGAASVPPRFPATAAATTSLAKRANSAYSLVPGAGPIELPAYYPEFFDYYEGAELQTKRWCVETVQPDWTVLDIGANVGIFSILFGKLASKGAVHAFEPTQTIDLLRQNIEFHKLGNVAVHQVALGARSGALAEPIYRMSGQQPETKTYDFLTLDDFVAKSKLERIDCVKIDVDGFDFDVLRGATATLERFNPWLIVELNRALATRHQSAVEAMEWLRGQGYDRAIVLDHDNFLMQRFGTASAPSKAALQIEFDRRPMIIAPTFDAGAPIEGLFVDAPETHNGAKSEKIGMTWRLEASGPRWSNAASWPIDWKRKASGPIFVEVDIEVASGTVGIGCLDVKQASYPGKEVTVSTASGVQTAKLEAPDADDIACVMLRSVSESDAPVSATVHGIRTYPRVPKTSVNYWPVLDPKCGWLDMAAYRSGSGKAGGPVLATAPGAGRNADHLRIVPVERLGDEMGFDRPFIPEKRIYRYAIKDFNTEVDETAIFAYIYKNKRPKKHLEFGTREGYGALLCARSCDAEIWTINLPEGERGAAGAPLYSSTATAVGATINDAGDKIGWRYRAAGMQHRVNQILLDSRALDTTAFSPGSFDTILIAGGHTPELVINDTRKSLPLLASGGLMIWHDFCPDAEVLANLEASKGVVTAVADCFQEWRPQLADIFWIRPSFLLIGVKA